MSRETLIQEIVDQVREEQALFGMDPQDLAIYNALPEEFTCYRGYGESVNEAGFHFTLNRKIAERYAAHHGDKGRVHTLTVLKRDCVYVGGRNEELIYAGMA